MGKRYPTVEREKVEGKLTWGIERVASEPERGRVNDRKRSNWQQEEAQIVDECYSRGQFVWRAKGMQVNKRFVV